MFKFIAITLFALFGTVGLANASFAENTICKGMQGIDIIQGKIPTTPDDAMVIAPGIDEYVEGSIYPYQEWKPLRTSIAPLTIRCFDSVDATQPKVTEVLHTLPNRCVFNKGTLTCGD